MISSCQNCDNNLQFHKSCMTVIYKVYPNIDISFNTACADPENFARGVQQLFCEGREDPNITEIGSSSARQPFKWRSAGGPIMSQHRMLAW